MDKAIGTHELFKPNIPFAGVSAIVSTARVYVCIWTFVHMLMLTWIIPWPRALCTIHTLKQLFSQHLLQAKHSSRCWHEYPLHEEKQIVASKSRSCFNFHKQPNCLPACLCQSAQARDHRLGGFSNRNLFAHISGSWKFQDRGVGRVGFS